MCTTLLDPQLFRTYMPFPSVALDNPGYIESDRAYWAGSVWLDQAYFAVKAIERCAELDDAFINQARAVALQLLENGQGVLTPGVALYENYHPTRQPDNAITIKARNFSWSAAHFYLLFRELVPNPALAAP